MNRLSVIAITAALALAACASEPEPQPVPVPSAFDRSFDAAVGAASDAGIQVRSADRATGRILGAKDGVEVTIAVTRQPDGTVRVEFDAPGGAQTGPKLSEQWYPAYQRRMGR